MIKFLSYILKLILLVFLSAYVVQYVADEGLKKIKNSLFYDWDTLLNGKLNSDIVALGYSRSYVSIDPAILERKTKLSTYNLSFNAGSYNLQELKYDAYLENNTAPNIIIQNIDMAHFTESTQLPASYQFIPFLSSKSLRDELAIFFDEYLLKIIFPLYKYNNEHRLMFKGIQSFFGRNYSLSPSSKGFSSKNMSFKRDGYNIKRLKALEKDLIDTHKYTQGISSVRNLIQDASLTKTSVVLVWLPEYLERLGLNKNLRKYLKKEIKTIVEGNKNAVFIDYSNDSISMDKTYFYDTFHLNKKGATFISRKMADTIKTFLK